MDLAAGLILAFIVLTPVYWLAIVLFVQDVFRQYCEQKFGVTIHHRGKYWEVLGAGSPSRTSKLNLLRPLFFLAAIGAWLLAATLFFVTMKLLGNLAE